MRNQHSIDAVGQSVFSTDFIRPLYDSYCFSNLPKTVENLLCRELAPALPVDAVGGRWDQYDLVLLFFIDGFGWKFFEEAVDRYPFLKRFLQEGIATKITSQFPSTTAAHVTTINTGQEVGQTGIYEWFYYEPLVDRMIAPLMYSFAGDHRLNTLAESGVTPERLYPFVTFYQQLAKRGVSSIVMQNEGIAHSPYSTAMFKGASNRPYRFLKDGLEQVIHCCNTASSQPQYLYFYFGDIDAAGHRHGIGSSQFNAAIKECWEQFEEGFWNKLSKSGKKIACLFTADHGMAPVDPKRTHYLNELFPTMIESFATNRAGKPLIPAGSCRDFFLHIKPHLLSSVHEQIQDRLLGVAEVYPTEHLISEGLFGKAKPSQRFLDRVGNLVILPYVNEAVWWYEKHRFEQHFYAAHGGLTRDEMESICLFLAIDR